MYNRAAHGTGIVHLGIGAFHRAHQAVYTDEALGAAGGDWMTTGVSLRSAGAQEQLNPQDGLFTVLEQDGHTANARIVGSINQVLFLGTDRSALSDLMADPAVRIVSLTITEKGYCRAPSTGALDFDLPDIVHDLEAPDMPHSAIGLIVQALAARRAKNKIPFTLLSCDNLPHNGQALKRVTVDFARARDPSLADWIGAEVRFPATMVDRIVPSTTQDVKSCVENTIGFEDAACVATEPFSQWIIEDDFTQGRPAWEKAGAILTGNVAPWEEMKLRLLNGAHSAMAYLGCLAGIETNADCMKKKGLRRFIETMMREEIAPMVSAPGGVNLDVYISQLIERFENSSLHHRCAQTAMDGSQKIPQRLLGTINERLQRGLPIPHLATAIAAWTRYVTGADMNGSPLHVDDPIAEDLAALTRPHRHDPASLARAITSETRVFTAELSRNEPFQNALTRALTQLIEHGPLKALDHV